MATFVVTSMLIQVGQLFVTASYNKSAQVLQDISSEMITAHTNLHFTFLPAVYTFLFQQINHGLAGIEPGIAYR